MSDYTIPGLSISLIFDRVINYAFQQNAIPVVKELRICNDSIPRKDLIIRVTTEPAFAAPVEVRLQGLAAGEEHRIAPLDLKLSPDFLAGLNEKVQGLLRVEVLDGSGEGATPSVVQSTTETISLLARNEWCGLVSLPEILAAFVLPNDPAVMPLLNRAAEILGANTGRTTINGYQDRNRKRAWEQVAAIYKAVAELGLRYISPPASFENTGQKVRFPSDIVAQRFGTCLDLALLFAACCEQAGLHPLLLLHEGHMYAGCWLEERTLSEPSIDDLQQVRKLSTDALITVFEATIVTDANPGTLTDAERLARPHLETDRPFRIALDIRRARMARIHPLPIVGQTAAPHPDAGGKRTAASDPGLGTRDFVEQVEPTPKSTAKTLTRIDQWKSRLLDLSLRNRLLNFKPTKLTIPILSASPEHVEDELAAETELSLQSKPRLMGASDPRHAGTYTRQQKADALADHLRDELKHRRLHSDLEAVEHGPRLTGLYRAARVALEENGTNTLYAAVGVLEWRETEHSDRVLRAPLLLVPVELKRKSVLEGFTLRRIDEETRLNVTLMEMLRQQFHMEIPGLDPLPEDESGVNVARVFHLFREAVRDLAGWEVKPESWLSQFSFTKFLLWKDLADRLGDLTRNRIVHHLVHEAGNQYPNPADDIRPEQLDKRFHPREIYCPRSADSSQLAAVMAAAAGHDFVLEGPPGTGKSQTISNIIAHCLASGKRVLFVAEKRAALDVVYRRLREEGLEPFCLELHSNKTGKADVVAQFDRSLKFMTQANAHDWERHAIELARVRAALNGYTHALHTCHPCGLSAYQCLDYLLPRQSEPTVRLDEWLALIETTDETLERLRELARLLQDRSRPLQPLVEHPLSPLNCEDWSPAWADRSLDHVRELGALTEVAAEAARDLRTWLECPGTNAARAELTHLHSLAECLLTPQPVGPAFATTPWDQLVADLDQWIALTQERAELRAKLTPLLKEQSSPALANAGLPIGPLDCEGWSPALADRLFSEGRQLGELITAASETSRHLRRSLGCSSASATRTELAHFRSLADCLLSSEPVGPAFVTISWSKLDADLVGWIALAQEQATLRAQLIPTLKRPPQSPEGADPDPSRKLACEKWSPAVADRIFASGRELGELIEAATEAANDLHTLLRLPTLAVSRAQLVHQIELVDSLLVPMPVGGAFATTPWKEIVVSLDEWIVLGRERTELRAKLKSYDETKLLALDLDDLHRRWESAQTAWFLAKWLRRAGVRKQLRTVRPDRVVPDIDHLPIILKSALRLRAIKASFTNATPTAKGYLGQMWADGEADADSLTQVRAWGETLHTRMAACAGNDEHCLKQLRQALGSLFKDGPTGYASGTSAGDRLNRYRDLITRFDEAFNALIADICLKRGAVDDAPDHLGAVAAAFSDFLKAATRLREINSNLSAATPTAQACLGVIWNNGEPAVEMLKQSREWGGRLNACLVACASDEVDWLARARHLFAGEFGEGQAAFSPGTPFGGRLIRYRDALSRYGDAVDAFSREICLKLDYLDHTQDYLTAAGMAFSDFLQSAQRLRAIDASLQAADPSAQACLGVIWNKGEPDADTLKQTHVWGKRLHANLVACAGDNLTWLSQARQLLANLFNESPAAYAPGSSIGERLTRYRDAFSQFDAAFDKFVTELHLQRNSFDEATDHFAAIQTLIERLPAAWPKLRLWCSWQKVRQEGLRLGLAPIISTLESAEGSSVDVPALFERSFRRALLFAITDLKPVLRDFFGREHHERIERFRGLDDTLATLTRDLIRASLAMELPRDQVQHDIPKAELGLLRKQIVKKMRHIPVRQLLSRIPPLLPRLKPCVLMSPLSVAQYLDASHEPFDVVIFDEASQIPVWDAVGAIARGKQLIVVGDPKQLPPTNFFNTSDDPDDEGSEINLQQDLESILDELLTNGLRHKRLQWHYRSRHEGLIAFSNRQYYENELLTFPSPETALGGVRFRHLAQARYDKGKSRTNLAEARALVDELVQRLRQADGPHRSYGVVTFSQAQQQLVEDLLDEERRKHPEIELHFGDEPPVVSEPVFVKNLENVQGDERDVILFSICYGPDETGRISMNFGPINRDGGERRLNVAITRAKHEVLVFSSLRGEQIDLTRTRARGVRDLKYFLEYAERGPKALATATTASASAEPDSEFEHMVADRIRAAGYEVHHQVGCSGYRIDLGVLDPKCPGRYLLGVECDGATYHRAATARDRDKLRQLILEGLGWKLHRVWSTDWWHDADEETRKLLAVISELSK